MTRTRVLFALGALLALGTTPVLADGFESDASTVQVITALVGGKNVFIPSTIVVTSGRDVTLSIFNTTDTPHGFRIQSLGIEDVLPPGQEHEVKLGRLAAGKIHRIDCQLHAAHRGATLVVLPGARED